MKDYKEIAITEKDIKRFGLGEDCIIDFFKHCGWDGEQNIDPRKFQINHITSNIMWTHSTRGMNADQRSALNLLWLNYSPSRDNSIPANKVRIHPQRD